MPVRRTLLVLLLWASAGWGAELRTLKGQVIKGDLARVTDKEIVLTVGGKEVSTPVPDVLQLDVAAGEKIPPDASYTDVELTDGTLLHCKQFLLKGKQAELPLLSGPTVKIPLSAVSSVLNHAEVEKNRREWAARVARRRTQDVVARVQKDADTGKDEVVFLLGTLGEGDEEGKTIGFTVTLGKRKITRALPLSGIQGLIFQRQPDPNAAPVVCRLYDTGQNLVMVSAVAPKESGLSVTTPSGATIEYKKEALARLDYSKGKLTFLSDLEPSTQPVETSTDEQVFHYQRNQTVDRKPLKIAGETFDKGLWVHSHTELEYDLKGDYREFKAVIGIDDNVPGIDGPVLVTVEADGKELVALTLTRKDKERAHRIVKNVKDVQKLRIVVTTTEPTDLGKHVDVADAKVSK